MGLESGVGPHRPRVLGSKGNAPRNALKTHYYVIGGQIIKGNFLKKKWYFGEKIHKTDKRAVKMSYFFYIQRHWQRRVETMTKCRFFNGKEWTGKKKFDMRCSGNGLSIQLNAGFARPNTP